MTDYKTNDPKGWGGDPSRGAAMGRGDIDEADNDTFKDPLTILLVPIDAGGYDPNGTYFGTGMPLYWVASTDGKIDRVFRSKNNRRAIAKVANWYTLAKVPERVEGLRIEVGEVELDAFTQGYLDAALFYSHDEREETDDDDGAEIGENLSDNFTVKDFSPESLAAAKKDCEDFQELQEDDLALAYATDQYTEERAGGDFWLTRHGHGAGFWDRGLGHVSDRLSDAAKVYGEVNLYVGDDGKIHGD